MPNLSPRQRIAASDRLVRPKNRLLGPVAVPAVAPQRLLDPALDRHLAITRRQVELMGGMIQLESTVGHGCRFYFQIPLPPARGQVVREKKDAREVLGLAAGHQVRALVVDDNENNRDVLAKLLSGIGCQVRLAASAFEAFDRVGEEIPDIIFMDIRMPRMNGAEATRKIIAEHGPDRSSITPGRSDLTTRKSKWIHHNAP